MDRNDQQPPRAVGEEPQRTVGQERERAPAGRTRRRSLAWRSRSVGASTVGLVGAGVLRVARLVMTLAVLIALLIGVGIVLRDLDANQHNTIVKGLHEGANFFAGAFTGLVTFAGHPKREITVDWGIAIIAYLLVGGLIARAIGGVGRGGLRFRSAHRAEHPVA